MLEYNELAKNPHHLNRNQEELVLKGDDLAAYNRWKSGGDATPGQKFGANVFNLLEMGADVYGYQDYDPNRLYESLEPLETSYETLRDLSEGYADENSALNVALRDDLRTQDLSSWRDMMRRQRAKSTGEQEGYGSEAIGSGIWGDAISTALDNYSRGQADRLKTAGDLSAKAMTAANILSQARRSNYALEMSRKQEQSEQMGKWFEHWGGQFI